MSNLASADVKQAVLERISDYTPWFAAVTNQRPSSGSWISGRCPFHADEHNSFSFDSTSGGWRCFSNCGSGDFFAYLMAVRNQEFSTVLRELGEELGVARVAQVSPPDPTALAERAARALQNAPNKLAWLRNNRGLTNETIVRFELGWDGRFTIPVRDDAGKIVNLRRYDAQKTPKMLNLKGCGSPARLFGVADLVAEPATPCIICEGEWDCLLLRQLGFLAVTGTAGVGHFRAEWLDYFRGRDVSIVFDCDPPGLAGATGVAAKLAAAGAKIVRVVRLPLAGTPHDKDVSDYVRQHDATPADFVSLIAATPPYSPVQVPVDIQINDRQPRDVVDDAWRALVSHNNPPRLFRQAGRVFHVGGTSELPLCELVTDPYLRTELYRAANWVRVSRSGAVTAARPPRELPAEILARPDDRLPVLEGVVAAPVFVDDGYLATGPGYDPEAKLWIHLDPELQALRPDTNPSSATISDARALFIDDLLVDFPFAEASDRAHAVAAILLPFMRRMIPGCTPLHLLEATTPGSGKTLLADLVSIIATGRSSEATTVTSNEEESKKKITSVLMRGAPIVLIDNVKGALESAQLACALTAETWRDRVLGGNSIIDLPNKTVWLVTANNPRLGEELVRRTVRIRIEPVEEHPWDRHTFKHPQIRQWTKTNRAKLVTAALTLVRAWYVAGKPKGERPMGSFDTWAAVMGGILKVAGIDGFLDNREQFYETADADGQQWRAFIEAWRQEYGHVEVTATQLLALAEQRDLIPFAIYGRTPQAQRVKLGNALGQLRDRRFGDIQVRVGQDKHTKARIYQLCPVQDALFSEVSAP